MTERRRADEALARSEQFSRAVLDALPIRIAILDDQGAIVAHNAAWGQPAGGCGLASAALGVGDSYLRFCDAEATRGSEAALRLGLGLRELLGGETSEVDVEYVSPADEERRWFAVRATQFILAGEPRVVLYYQEITIQKRAQGELLEREAQLRQAQKMEAIGRLAGGVAHDFNNLLAVINGYSELCLMRPELPVELRELVLDIRGAGDRATVLTRQLLTFSRRQTAEPMVLDLNEVVRGLERLLRRLIGEDVQLSTTLAPDLLRIRADAGQMEQVLMNLAINARDAMPQGGLLEIQTIRGMHQPDPHGPVAEAVVLTVRDSGCGIDPDTQARIFEPFFTTKPEGEGTGLGLFTVYGIVAQGGGSIQVDSEIGRGTTFRITFPAVCAEKTECFSAPAPPPVSGSETVLIVEDEDLLRNLLSEILQGAGYRVVIAHDPQHAIQMAQSLEAPLHLLLADVVMPGLSGPEVADAVLARHPEAGVLYMSGYQLQDTMRHGVRRPEERLLQKPFTPTALLRKVREILDAGPEGFSRGSGTTF